MNLFRIILVLIALVQPFAMAADHGYPEPDYSYYHRLYFGPRDTAQDKLDDLYSRNIERSKAYVEKLWNLRRDSNSRRSGKRKGLPHKPRY